MLFPFTICLFWFLAFILLSLVCYKKIQKDFALFACFLLFLFPIRKHQKYFMFFFGFVKFIMEFNGLRWLERGFHSILFKLHKWKAIMTIYDNSTMVRGWYELYLFSFLYIYSSMWACLVGSCEVYVIWESLVVYDLSCLAPIY